MDAADQNFARSVGVFAASGKTGEAVDALDYVLGNSRAPVAEFNQAFLKRPDYKLTRAIDRMFAYYAHAGVPFRVHVRAESTDACDLLGQRGLTEKRKLPVMVLDGARCATLQPVSGLEIRRVGSGTADPVLADFQRVSFESFGYPAKLGPVAMTPELASQPGAQQFVGYIDGEPACCSMLLVTGEMAGIYWVGTLAGFRARGLGAAITAHAVEVGRKLGCTEACLQASDMGAPVYTRLGFRQLRAYAMFETPTSE